MRSGSRSALLPSALPFLVLAVGLFPPHVHPGLIAVPGLLALALAIDLAWNRRLPSARPGAVAPLVVAAGIAAASACLALQPLRSFRILAAWFVGGLVFLSARYAPGGGYRRIVVVIALMGSLLGALGLYQTFVAFPEAARVSDVPSGAAVAGGVDYGVDDEVARAAEAARLRSGRAVGTLGLPALLASILILAIPSTVVETILATGTMRVVWGSATAIQLAALAATRSLGGAAALTLSVAAIVPIFSELRPATRRILAAVILVAAAAAALPRLLETGEQSGVRSLGLRASNWGASLSMIVSHPILGVGPDNFGVAYPRNRPVDSNESQHAHNSCLELVSDLGLPFLPLLGLGVFSILRRVDAVSRGSESDAADRWRRRALAAGCLAWIAQGLVDFTAYVAASFIPFLAVAGAIHRDDEAGDDRRIAGLPWRAALLTVSAAVAVLSVADSISRRHLESAVAAAGDRSFDAAILEAGWAARWNPIDPEPRLVLAESRVARLGLLRPDDPARREEELLALADAEAAVRLDPETANRRASLARARASAGDVAGAYAAMAQASRLNPFRRSYAFERDALEAILTGGGGAPSPAGGISDR